MKKIVRKKQIKSIYYQCEICKAEYISPSLATKCKKSHTCKHEPVFTFTDSSEDAWWFNVTGITSECKLCGIELENINFEDIEENQLILKTIFELIKKHNQQININ